tara:strand:- start:4288 stop:4410 length:123 start_codon:yes stop_codon:yes gene_type:complete
MIARIKSYSLQLIELPQLRELAGIGALLAFVGYALLPLFS